jgi:formylglycine-generating enzyme required for sulfatase activity
VVGIFPRDRSVAFDVFDIGGNVWEWCDDSWSPYEASSGVVRGGGWDDEAEDCRTAHRSCYKPSFRDHYLGFRVATVPSSKRAGSSRHD